MKVQMVHYLAGRTAIVHLQPPTPFNPRLLGHFAHSHQELAGQLLIVQFIQIQHVLLRHHQDMHRCFGMNIFKGRRHLVLPKQFGFVTIRDPAKQAFIIHVVQYSKPSFANPLLLDK